MIFTASNEADVLVQHVFNISDQLNFVVALPTTLMTGRAAPSAMLMNVWRYSLIVYVEPERAWSVCRELEGFAPKLQNQTSIPRFWDQAKNRSVIAIPFANTLGLGGTN